MTSAPAPLGDDPPWQPWTPEDVAARLEGVGAPWAVAGGWALDLFGAPPRRHGDVEVTVPAAGFTEIRAALPGFDWGIPSPEGLYPLDSEEFGARHQTWLRDPRTGLFHLDVFREPHDGDTWVCRRDESLRRPYSEVVRHTPAGVPFVAPEIVLLFKAKAARPNDERDLTVVLPLLDEAARRWLAAALDTVHPGHPWRERLGRLDGSACA